MILTIKAVLFDMGNTLVKYDYGSPEEVFQKILLTLGVSRSLDDIQKAFVNTEKEAENIKLFSSFGKIKCEDYWHQWNSIVLKHLKIAGNQEIARVVHPKWFDYVDGTLYPEVKEVLSELKKRRLRIGLISNGYEEEIDFVLKEANLEEGIFDIIVGVDTVKKVKPSLGIFKYALNSLNVEPEETLFVGDNVEVDYKGAEKAGMYALLVDRTEKQQEGLKTIKSLKEILIQIDHSFYES